MSSSLIPERPILIYPGLAATLGLEESVLLSVLSDLAAGAEVQAAQGFEWRHIETNTLRSALPFWDDRDIVRLGKNLHAKGVLLQGPNLFGTSSHYRFAFNERVATASTQLHKTTQQKVTPQQAPATTSGKNYIASNWQPDTNTLAQLAQHNIPDNFSYEQLPEFVTYWRDSGEVHRSWGAKFISWVIRKWRTFEAQRNRQDQNSPMQANWWPSEDAMDVLTVHAGIRREFVEDAIPEFILYWKERGDSLKTWNSKFIQHVRIQWKKFNTALEHSTDPKPISTNWQPSEDVYDVLRLANIDVNFATGLIPEFILYWRDSNQIHTSWNTRFLQHAKREWAKRHAITSPQAGNETRSTRDITLEEELADRSWAN
ncbi:DnaT-like ssDNA-binding domain-containing protein [Teredinibacter haidensis]|uniref:DnaT-like ssDNA-binding domain-containing protein n=1 Tax=Teredinibacter haidensis TaxID=2731755 RepID=UPI000948D379|nr:DnaT-like ssDNA-binding domain-containing protein [Teredinibacter haidensis]